MSTYHCDDAIDDCQNDGGLPKLGPSTQCVDSSGNTHYQRTFRCNLPVPPGGYWETTCYWL